MISKLSSHLGPASIFLGGGSVPSLVLDLDAGNTYSYPGTGNTWYDLTNLNNDISLSNTLYSGIFRPDAYNTLTNFKGSILFDGSTSFGSIISGTAIPIGDSHYTIESWFQANSYVGEDGALIGWGDYGVSNSVNVIRQSGDSFLNYWWGSDISGSGTVSSTNWYHLVCTYNGTDRNMYLNGESISSDTPGSPHNVPYFNNLTVGLANTNEFFDGKISTIKVYNKSLNSSQILDSFNSNKSKYGYDFGSMIFSSSNSSYVASSDIYYEISTNDFTLEAFVKTATQSGYDGIVSLSSNSTQIGPRINISNTGCFEFWGSSGYNTYTASNDTWYHVSMSRNSGTVSCFVNGILQNQFYDNTDFNSTDIVVGRYYTNHNDHYIDGYISNVRLINGTGLYTSDFTVPTTPLSSTVSNTKFLITSQEINPVGDVIGHTTTNYNTGWTSSLPSLYVTNGLICYLDNYTGGSTWYDLSGNGNNATLYNGYSYNSTNGGVVRFDGAGIQNNLPSTSRGEINLDLTSTPCTIMYGTRYLQNTPGFIPSGRSLGGKNNNWLLGTWANSVNQFYTDSGSFVYGGTPNLSDMDWHIYTGTVNGPVKFWNNGTKLVETAPSGDGPNGIVLASDTYGEASNCDISFVLVYDRVLTDVEIELNFNHFRGRLGL